MAQEIQGNSKKRIEWIDIAKAVTIILMILGHDVERGTSTRELIFSFHMPLFIVLSGYTYKLEKSCSKAWKSTCKDFTRLVIPVFVVTILEIILVCLKNVNFEMEFIKSLIVTELKSLFWASGIDLNDVPAIGVIWFLLSLFWLRVIVRIVILLFEERSVPYILYGLSFLGILLGNSTRLPQNFDVVLTMTFFFATGLLWRKYEDFVRKYEFQLFIVSLVGLSIFLYYDVYIEMAMRSYPMGLLCFVEGCMGTFVVCILSEKILELPFVSKFLIPIGQGTLTILCIHHFDFYTMKYWYCDNLIVRHMLRILTVLFIFTIIQILKNIVKKFKSNTRIS